MVRKVIANKLNLENFKLVTDTLENDYKFHGSSTVGYVKKINSS
jgi:hypothetical protein